MNERWTFFQVPSCGCLEIRTAFRFLGGFRLFDFEITIFSPHDRRFYFLRPPFACLSQIVFFSNVLFNGKCSDLSPLQPMNVYCIIPLVGDPNLSGILTLPSSYEAQLAIFGKPQCTEG